jgi:hypothetical protein
LKGALVNRALVTLNGGLLEIKLSVPLIHKIIFDSNITVRVELGIKNLGAV